MTTNVLFVCPHGAAKSVLASNYFQHMANDHNLDVQVSAAGTDPDDHVAPAVTQLLLSEGIDISSYSPRRVTTEDLQNADVIVSLGCDDLLTPELMDRLRNWEVPAPSQDLPRASAVIHALVTRLIDELRSATV
jgi:protein-tyrosine-phosphatase